MAETFFINLDWVDTVSSLIIYELFEICLETLINLINYSGLIFRVTDVLKFMEFLIKYFSFSVFLLG